MEGTDLHAKYIHVIELQEGQPYECVAWISDVLYCNQESKTFNPRATINSRVGLPGQAASTHTVTQQYKDGYSVLSAFYPYAYDKINNVWPIG